MHLKILGTRGEIEASLPRHSKKSGVLIDDILLLDLGEKQYLKYDPKWILITHLHPDHAYFMRRGKEEHPLTEAEIFAPEKPASHAIRILNQPTKIGPYHVIPIPTHHSKHVLSQAYLIEKGGISILYTGDLVWIDKKYHHLFKEVDLVITDGSYIREGGVIRKDPETEKLFGHNGIPNLIRLFRPYTKKILFIHFGTWFYQNVKESREKLLSLGKIYKINILVGHDGLDLELKST